MGKLFHRILYRLLSLENYLRVVSRMFFLYRALGLGRGGRALEYVYHLPQLVKQGDKVIDIGANLGYYTCPLADLVGEGGRVYAVEPVPVIFGVLKRNVGSRKNVTLLNYALGAENKSIEMANDSVAEAGYFGTGRNFVSGGSLSNEAVRFEAKMVEAYGLFKDLERVDFIKCDIEGYEGVVMPLLKPLLAQHHPTVLIETDGDTRLEMISLFSELGYSAYMLQDGKEVELNPQSDKDIIFRSR
jgi:FkbM family methyltransferase